MEFKIDAGIYLRLCTAALQPDESNTKHNEAIRSVRIEYRDGVGIAVASCGKLLVAECLSEAGENGEVNITIDPALQTLAIAERDASGMLIITQAPGWTVARGIETGKMLPMNAEIAGEWPDWRALVPRLLPSKNTGSFVLSSHVLQRIAAASPSGQIVLPKFADKSQPILMRDEIDPNWLALMFLNNGGRSDLPPYAEIPEWVL